MDSTCITCGNTFKRYSTIRMTCGDCYYRQVRKTSSKPRKPLTRSQKPLRQRGKQAKKWEVFRDKVARPYLDKNFGIACVDCGVLPPMKDDGTHYRHDVDHIKGKGSHPELRYDVTNMAYRCRSCHERKTGVPQWSNAKTRSES